MGPKVMNEAIRELTDDDIEALLSYYTSQQDWPAHILQFDPPLVESESRPVVREDMPPLRPIALLLYTGLDTLTVPSN